MIMVAVRWSTAHLIHYQISESWRNHYIWDVCSASRWDVLKTATPAAGTGQQHGPNSLWQHLTTCSTTNTSKVEGIGLWSFASSATFTWLLANHHFLQASEQISAGQWSQELLLQPASGRKWFPRVHWIPKHGFLCYRTSHLQKFVECNGPILINKDVFEPSYNDLKFMVRNPNYVCTNLICL